MLSGSRRECPDRDTGSISCESYHEIGQAPCLSSCLSDQAAIRFSRVIANPSISVSYGVLPSHRFPWLTVSVVNKQGTMRTLLFLGGSVRSDCG
jgi:hypothetical protein